MIKEISKAASLEELKTVGAKIANAKISQKKRIKLINAYRVKRRELERAFVDASKNNTFKHCLYKVNTMTKEGAIGVAKVGKNLYALVKKADSGIDKIEASILFRAYRYQKNKAGISFEKPMVV